MIHDMKTAPISCYGNRGGSLALFVLFQALTQLLAGVLDRSLRRTYLVYITMYILN